MLDRAWIDDILRQKKAVLWEDEPTESRGRGTVSKVVGVLVMEVDGVVLVNTIGANGALKMVLDIPADRAVEVANILYHSQKGKTDAKLARNSEG